MFKEIGLLRSVRYSTLLNNVTTGVSTFEFRVGMTGIPIMFSPGKSWIYITSTLNSIMGLEAVSTQ